MDNDDLTFLRPGNAPLPAVEPKGITIYDDGGWRWFRSEGEEIERTRNSTGDRYSGTIDLFDHNPLQ